MKYKKDFLSKSKKPISLLIHENSKNPVLTIIESHGGIAYSAHEIAKENERLIEFCSPANINYIAIDFTNNGTRKDQPVNELIFSNRIKDLETAIDFVLAEYKSPILLYGSSLGGHITLNAATYSSEIKGIILNCPALKAFENIRDGMDKDQFDSWKTKGTALVGQDSLPYAFYEDLASHVAMDIVRSLKMPILIFQGTADKITPVKNARQAKELNSNIELVEVEGGGHRFGDKILPDEYSKKVQQFIKSVVLTLARK